MTRHARNSRDAEHLLSLFAAFIAAALVSAFLRDLALYILGITALGFAWLVWHRKPSHTDFTIRLGVGAFIIALAAVLIRPHLNLGLS